MTSDKNNNQRAGNCITTMIFTDLQTTYLISIFVRFD